MIAMQVPMVATSLSSQLPKAFTALAPQVLPEVLPKVLPSLLPQLLVLMNATLPDLLPSILPKVLPALLPQIIADSPQIVTQIIRDLPAILANVSDGAGSQQPAASEAGTTSSSPATGKLAVVLTQGACACSCYRHASAACISQLARCSYTAAHAGSANLPPIQNVISSIASAIPRGRRLQQLPDPATLPLSARSPAASEAVCTCSSAPAQLPPLPALPLPGNLPNPDAALPSGLPSLPPIGAVVNEITSLLPNSTGRRLLQAEQDPMASAMQPLTSGLVKSLGGGRCTLLMVGMALLTAANLVLLCLFSIDPKQARQALHGAVHDSHQP